MSKLSAIIEDLSQRKRTIACNGKSGLLLVLDGLGFKWTEGKATGHKVFVHPFLSKKTSGGFTTHGVDCGHKPDREMKFQYVVKTISLLKKYELELEEYLAEGVDK